MDNDTLQKTLNNLVQAGSRVNPAYNTLLSDYTLYHTVLVVEGSIVTFLLMVFTWYCLQRFKRIHHVEHGRWPFEKKVYFGFGVVSSIVTLSLLLLVAANLSTVLHPQTGFAQSLPDLGTPQAGTYKATLHQAVATWAQSGTAAMPATLQDAVRNRLAWQLPKAIVCSMLFLVCALLTAYLWRTLIHASATAARWRLKERVGISLGVLAVPVTLLLMLMALANTQAAFAPITLTLLFG